MLVLGACLGAGAQVGAQAGGAGGLQLAVTFDDLPAHGARPPGQTRLEIIQAILATLQREQMPPPTGL